MNPADGQQQPPLRTLAQSGYCVPSALQQIARAMNNGQADSPALQYQRNHHPQQLSQQVLAQNNEALSHAFARMNQPSTGGAQAHIAQRPSHIGRSFQRMPSQSAQSTLNHLVQQSQTPQTPIQYVSRQRPSQIRQSFQHSSPQATHPPLNYSPYNVRPQQAPPQMNQSIQQPPHQAAYIPMSYSPHNFQYQQAPKQHVLQQGLAQNGQAVLQRLPRAANVTSNKSPLPSQAPQQCTIPQNHLQNGQPSLRRLPQAANRIPHKSPLPSQVPQQFATPRNYLQNGQPARQSLPQATDVRLNKSFPTSQVQSVQAASPQGHSQNGQSALQCRLQAASVASNRSPLPSQVPRQSVPPQVLLKHGQSTLQRRPQAANVISNNSSSLLHKQQASQSVESQQVQKQKTPTPSTTETAAPDVVLDMSQFLCSSSPSATSQEAPQQTDLPVAPTGNTKSNYPPLMPLEASNGFCGKGLCENSAPKNIPTSSKSSSRPPVPKKFLGETMDHPHWNNLDPLQQWWFREAEISDCVGGNNTETVPGIPRDLTEPFPVVVWSGFPLYLPQDVWKLRHLLPCERHQQYQVLQEMGRKLRTSMPGTAEFEDEWELMCTLMWLMTGQERRWYQERASNLTLYCKYQARSLPRTGNCREYNEGIERWVEHEMKGHSGAAKNNTRTSGYPTQPGAEPSNAASWSNSSENDNRVRKRGISDLSEDQQTSRKRQRVDPEAERKYNEKKTQLMKHPAWRRIPEETSFNLADYSMMPDGIHYQCEHIQFNCRNADCTHECCHKGVTAQKKRIHLDRKEQSRLRSIRQMIDTGRLPSEFRLLTQKPDGSNRIWRNDKD